MNSKCCCVKNSSKDATRIISELNSLRDVIEDLFQLAERDELENKHHCSSNLEKLAKSDGPLARCVADLENLEKKLERKKGWRAARTAILWPLKEGDMRKSLQEINSTKLTVQLALAADQR